MLVCAGVQIESESAKKRILLSTAYQMDMEELPQKFTKFDKSLQSCDKK